MKRFLLAVSRPLAASKLLAALALSATLVVAGCRGPKEQGRGSAQLRVVSLHDVTTELIVALGAVSRLVGMADLVDASDELRAATAGVPRVAGPSPSEGAGELEMLLTAQPDFVLGLQIVKLKSPDIVASLERHGKSVYLPALSSVSDVETLIREVARRLKKESEGERLLADLAAHVGAPAPAREPRRVFVYDCCDPPFTAGRRTVLSDLIGRVGGRNVFGDVDAAYTHVSWEEVLLRKPELIVVHAYGEGGSADVSGKIAALRGIEALRALPVTVMPLRYSLGGLKTGEAATVLRSALTGTGPT
ncbi:MAG TPA: helical backbone metal receptor [Polyangiaceae bacterium]|nr:helical backbone metal receptor [Polyangiaceae bacterium]